MNKKLGLLAFVLGLLAVAWVALGYRAGHTLALSVTLLIGAFYLVGGAELRRYQQATAALAQALAQLNGRAAPTPEGPAAPQLGDWLASLPAGLQNTVRQRVEGERVGLPGPVMTPYLVGLLVLLGMLGTFLGMVVTLNGAVLALESTTDVATIRAALAAPVKGLGVAFGTSVAGVAASAMLGLVSALCRRERLQAAQQLDTHIATTWRGFSLAHQRQESFKHLQAQATALPAVAQQLQALMVQLAQQSQALNDQLLANQQGFQQHAQAAYTELAASVDRTLRHSVTESARLAGATLQPVVQATMDGIARETTALQTHLADSVQTQLQGLAARFDSTVTTVASTWTQALAQQDGTWTRVLNEQDQTWTRVLAQQDSTWNRVLAQQAHQQADAAARQAEDQARLHSGLGEALAAFSQQFDTRSAALLAAVDERQQALQTGLQRSAAALTQDAARWHSQAAQAVQAQLDGVAQRLDGAVGQVADTWQAALAQQQQGSAHLLGGLQAAVQALTGQFEQQTGALLATVGQAQGRLQQALAAQDHQRQAALAATLGTLATDLQREWQQAGERSLGQQTLLCQTLEHTVRDMQAQAESHTRSTVAEVARLMQAASEAPRAAAELTGLLREKLSDSLARDNELLAERSRTMSTLNTLLEAVNHAATAQRSAIDGLVNASAELLQGVGSRFHQQVAAESTRLGDMAAQLSGSAAEVASLGESFGAAVQQFSSSNEALMVQLQRIEASLNKSTARSDEQLAYYVAQAREVIDLSISSQRHIVDDLQRLALQRAPLASEAA